MKKKITITITSLLYFAALAQQYEIVFFFEPLITQDAAEEPIDSAYTGPIKPPDPQQTTKATSQAHKGILVEYAGYWTASDQSGKVSLLREQTEPVIYIIVSNQIKPIIRHGQTVDYFIYNTNKVAIYKATQIKDALENYFWKIEKATLPNNRIPPNSILIFNEPDFVIITEGTFATNGGPNWLLPLIHVRGNITNKQIISTLDMLNVNPYFRRISKLYQESKDRYASLIKRY